MSQSHTFPATPRHRDDAAFRRQVRAYYRLHGRHDLPWRQPEPDGSFDPYKILVSEAMLQQTQVGRVIPKFNSFIKQFPDAATLARASLGDVLRAWNGLGYNRRAKFLHEAAQQIVDQYGEGFPANSQELVKLPGVGPNTAGAILAYAFNRPAVFVETNIRTAYIHHFFAGQTAVEDRVVLAALTRTLPKSGIRVWYWALMDYGTFLKQAVGNLNRASRSYAKQTKFAGSKRQIRGQVIRLLSERPYSSKELQIAIDDERLAVVLAGLTDEGLIRKAGQRLYL
jgi:A/G-specific adenine glycosylase